MRHEHQQRRADHLQEGGNIRGKKWREQKADWEEQPAERCGLGQLHQPLAEGSKVRGDGAGRKTFIRGGAHDHQQREDEAAPAHESAAVLADTQR